MNYRKNLSNNNQTRYFNIALIFDPIINISKKYFKIFFIIFLILFIIHTSASLNIVNCVEPLTNFFQRQHNIRVEIINDLIINTSKLDELIAINKIVKTKVALLWEPILSTDPSSLEPLSPDFKVNPHPVKSFFFWLFMIFLCLMGDGLITFGTFMFSDTNTLQEITLSNFFRISDNYEFVKDCYDLLVKTEIINDSSLSK